MTNELKSPPSNETRKSETAYDLLESIKYIREIVGDGLQDEEFNAFVTQKKLRPEAGFGFLCFHNGCVTFSVPRQDDRAWHPVTGWICHRKEELAEGFGKKHKLSVSEPPDTSLLFQLPNNAWMHHHFRFYDRRETIVIAHPEFLKIRLYDSDKQLPLPRKPGFLADLSALYL